MSPEFKSLKIYPCYSGCTYDAGPVCMASNDFMGGPCAGYQLHCEPVAIYTMRRPGTLANEGLLSRFISVCHVSLGRQAVVFSRWHSQLQQFQGEVPLGPAPPLPAPPRPALQPLAPLQQWFKVLPSSLPKTTPKPFSGRAASRLHQESSLSGKDRFSGS